MEEPTSSPAEALAAAAGVGPEWSQYVKIVTNAENFIATVHRSEHVGAAKFTKTIKVFSRKPTYARCEVVDGDGAGGVVVWHGGPNIQAHPGGEHAAIVVTLPRHSSRVTDLLGYGCGDQAPAALVGYVTRNGKLTESAGPTLAGTPTDVVTWIPNPSDMIKLTKQELFLSKSTHLIVATKSYQGDVVVENSTWDVQVDPGVKYGVFDINN